ncbi:MAG: helicase RepA family protein [Leptospirillum sp.]
MSASAKIHRPVEVLRNIPIDIDNERNLISCLIQRPELVRDESLYFSVEDFHFEPHIRIVQAIINLDAEGVLPDIGMVGNRLPDPSDRDYLLDISDVAASPHPSNAKAFLKELWGVAIKRQALFDADKLQKAALSGIPDDIARVRAEIGKREDPDEGEFAIIRPSVAFSKILPLPVYVLPSLRPLTAGLMIAQEGVGKSFLALEIGLAKATDHDITGIGVTGPGRVIYFSKEDPPGIIEERLQSIRPFIKSDEAMARADNLEIVSLYGKPATLVSEKTMLNEKLIRQIIKAGSGKDLLIFDTLRKLHDLEENSSGEMKVLLEIFDRIALETGAAVLLIHHTNKSANLNGQQGDQSSARGSNAIVGNTRWSLHLETVKNEPEGEKRIKVTIPRASYGPEGGEWWLERTDGGVLVQSNPIIRFEIDGTPQRSTKKTTLRRMRGGKDDGEVANGYRLQYPGGGPDEEDTF